MKPTWRRWVALLDTREPPHSLAVMRMVLGATAALTLAHAWWSGAARVAWVGPEHGGLGGTDPGWLALFGGLTWPNVCVVLSVGLVSNVLLVLGWHTRAAAVVSLIAFRGLVFANPESGGAGDDLVSGGLLLIVFSGAGAAWSLDARGVLPCPRVTAWPRYVAMGQLIAVYVSSGWHKTSGSWMPLGSLDAVWYALQNPIWQRRPIPATPLLGRLAQCATSATWWFEISVPVLFLALYYRATATRPGRLRAWFNRHDVRAMYLALGFCLHLGIELTLEVGAFFGGMMALYAACVHPAEWRRLAAWASRGGRAHRGA